MEETFVYLVNNENHGFVIVMCIEKEKISELKNSEFSKYITSDKELNEYMEKYPDNLFMYSDDLSKKEAYRLSDLFGVRKM